MDAEALLYISHALCCMIRTDSGSLACEIVSRPLVTTVHVAQPGPGLCARHP